MVASVAVATRSSTLDAAASQLLCETRREVQVSARQGRYFVGAVMVIVLVVVVVAGTGADPIIEPLVSITIDPPASRNIWPSPAEDGFAGPIDLIPRSVHGVSLRT